MLPVFLPGLVRWADRRQEEVLRTGEPLTEEEIELASQAGVEFPDRIRIEVMDQIPMPAGVWLERFSRWAGFAFEPAGLSLGYAVMVRTWEGRNSRLLTHEFVHTSQYERMGGMARYLEQYLKECLTYGYEDAPMEEEAVVETGRIFGWNS